MTFMYLNPLATYFLQPAFKTTEAAYFILKDCVWSNLLNEQENMLEKEIE